MKSRSGEKIKLTSIDELLGVVNEESAMEIEINRIHAFKDHPFKVIDNDELKSLEESIRNSGVLSPAIVRKKEDGRYEMVSGHRRKFACNKLGLGTI